jgi:hypothetical protein
MEAIGLITCSVCLSVLDGTEWIEAERAITHLRSFALPVPPRLEAALCDTCMESIRRRRMSANELVA